MSSERASGIVGSFAGSASRVLAIALLAATVSTLGCQRDALGTGDDIPTVEAEPYAHGLCSLKCFRLVECGINDDSVVCEDACTEAALDEIHDDSCWAQRIEARRCRVRWTSCDRLADESAPDSGVCDGVEDRLSACER